MPAVSVVLSLAPSIALAQVTDGWAQYQGGAGHTGSAADGPAPAYRLDWALPLTAEGPGNQYGVSAPVVAGDDIVVVGFDQVVGVDSTSGDQAWAVDRDPGPSVAAAIARVDGGSMVVYTEGFGDGPPDPDASPSAEGGSPSAAATPAGGGEPDGAGTFDSHLAAFDLQTREPSFDPVPLEAVSRTGVTVQGTTAFVGAGGGRMYAVDLTKGSVAWGVELGRPFSSPPTVVGDTVLVGLQSTQASRLPTVVALNAADGEERWRADDDAAASIVSTVAADDATAYVAFSGSQESSVDSFELQTGDRNWRARLPRLFDPTTSAPPVITDDAIVATDALGVTFALDPATGARIWDFALNQNVFRAAPIAVAGHVLVGTAEGELAALEAATGELVWRSGTSDRPIRAMAVAGERIVLIRAGTDAGLEAYAHDPDGTLIREVSPTTPDIGVLALNIGIAGLAVAGVTLVLGRLLARRTGPAFPEDLDANDETDEDEIDDDEDAP